MTILCENLAFDSAGTLNEKGFWTTRARFARPGVQEYSPAEFAAWPESSKIVGRKARMLRPESVVFDPAAMKSFENSPISVEHSGGILNPSNVQREIVGAAGYPVTRDGDTLVVPVTLYTQDAIKKAKSGERRELSAGYLFDVVYKPGIDEKYGEYDYIMTRWSGNHITLTREGKAGPEFFVGDRMPDEKKENAERLVFRVLDSVSYGFSEQAAQVFDRVLGERDAARVELETAKKQILSDAEINKRVDERFAIFDSARKVVDEKDLRGKSTDDMIKLVVAKSFEGLDTAGKEAPYMRALFDSAVRGAEKKTTEGERAMEGNGEKALDSANAGKRPSEIARANFINKNSGRRRS